MSDQIPRYWTDGRIAFSTLNRPERLNAIMLPMPDEFEAAVHTATHDRTVEVIVLHGAGYDFGTGFHHWNALINTDGHWDPGKDFGFATAPQT